MLDVRILAVDDYPDVLDMLTVVLRQEGRVIKANSVGQASDILKNGNITLLIVDLEFKNQDRDGLSLLDEVATHYPTIPVIVLSGDTETERVVRAHKYRLVDFVVKGGQNFRDEIKTAVRKALLHSTSSREENPVFRSHSPKMRSILDRALRMVQRGKGGTILITGETGVGKEIMARHIAALMKKELVPVNMGGIPASLIESELFGSKKGSFSGALMDRQGIIRASANKICFMDEIGDCPFPLQVTLLRTLSSNEVRAVGSTAPEIISVQFIAATNRNLAQMVRERTFREDLFARLNTHNIWIPQLRDRKEDILLYAEQFLNPDKNSERYSLSPSAEEALLSYTWPRNVRELKNAIERMKVDAPSLVIDGDVVREAIKEQGNPNTLLPSNNPRIPKSVELLNILKRLKGNRSHAAKHYGVTYKTIVRWMKAYRIDNVIQGKDGRPRSLPAVGSNHG